MTAPMNFLAGGKDLKVFRKPAGGDSWGEKKVVHAFTLENVGVAPRTSKTQDGEGFRGRIQSGYTLYLDHEQTQQLQQDDEIEVEMPDGTKVRYALDGLDWGANWDNPLSFWSPGTEVNLKFLRGMTP